MVRCTHRRVSFEAETPGPLPACVQCGGDTMLVITMGPSREADGEESWPPTPTAKFYVVGKAAQ